MSEIKALEKLRELDCDINGQEIIDHMQLYPSCVFDGTWLDSWHREFDRLANAIQAEVDERFMELPVDADGVPIRVGDVVKCTFADDNATVKYLSLQEDGWSIVVDYPDGRGHRTPESMRHVKPRTLEDVLCDFANDVAMQGHQIGLTAHGLSDKYAAEIRELLGVDA